MWLITPIGFFSIVQKPGDKGAGTLTIRARLRSDLTALQKHYLPGLGTVTESLDSDYRFRATAPRAQVAAAMARMVDGLDYGNFKSEVAKRQGSTRAHLYHDVWSVLYRLQTDKAFSEKIPVADNCGGVLLSGGGRVLLRASSASSGGDNWTFAKAPVKHGESPQDTALRAVREKTGYAATIRGTVPGVFKGSTSSTRYFLMEASHPPVRTMAQTALRWVRFDEARELIRRSTSAAGRARDLEVLDAAELAASAIPYREHARTQPEDWSTLQDMPAPRTVLHPQHRYTAAEMANIQRGFVPTVMEQKWFLYFTGERLRMHRSWTGILIYDVGFRVDAAGGASITEVVVNREPEQYGNTDDDEDLKLMLRIIEECLLTRLESPVVDGFVEAMTLVAKPNYLGSPEVVSDLVRGILEIAVKAIKGEATVEELQACAERVIAAFTDDDAGYTRMPGWHSAEQMGACVRKYLGGNPGVDGEAPLAALLDAGLAAVLAKLFEMLVAYFEDAGATWQDHALVQLNDVHAYVVAVLLGTNTLRYGNRTLDTFRWVPSSRAHEDSKELLLEVGAEGGSVKLFGSRSSKGWAFRVETNETALMDEDETLHSPERPWVTTWRGALKQLDACPWPQLYPLTVREDFRQPVMKALRAREKKGAVVDWDIWGRALGIAPGK